MGDFREGAGDKEQSNKGNEQAEGCTHVITASW